MQEHMVCNMAITYKRKFDENELEFLMERHELAIERIKSVCEKCETDDEYYPYFNQVALFLRSMDEVLMDAIGGTLYKLSMNKKIQKNKDLYIDLRPRYYENNYLNPSYAVRKFGKEYLVHHESFLLHKQDIFYFPYFKFSTLNYQIS